MSYETDIETLWRARSNGVNVSVAVRELAAAVRLVEEVRAKYVAALADQEASSKKFVNTRTGRTPRPMLRLQSPSERAFAESVRERGEAQVLRSGWPDFMLERDGGTVCGVEVKGPGDAISHSQALCFSALERGGVTVYVWTPTSADLIPWRWFAREFGIKGCTAEDVEALAGPFPLASPAAFKCPEEPTGDRARETEIARGNAPRQDGIGGTT